MPTSTSRMIFSPEPCATAGLSVVATSRARPKSSFGALRVFKGCLNPDFAGIRYGLVSASACQHPFFQPPDQSQTQAPIHPSCTDGCTSGAIAEGKRRYTTGWGDLYSKGARAPNRSPLSELASCWRPAHRKGTPRSNQHLQQYKTLRPW
jgi:hypothetical protein